MRLTLWLDVACWVGCGPLWLDVALVFDRLLPLETVLLI